MPKQPVRVSSSESQASAYLPPPASALTTWWTPDSGVKNGQFTLVYAGSGAFEKAIVLLFSNPVGDASSTGLSGYTKWHGDLPKATLNK